MLHLLKGASVTTLTERLALLEHADASRVANDLRVIRLQLARAEGKILRGRRDVRRELRIIEQRVLRAERRLRRAERLDIDVGDIDPAEKGEIESELEFARAELLAEAREDARADAADRERRDRPAAA